MPRTFTALAAAEVAHFYPFITIIIFLNINIMFFALLHHHAHPICHKVVQVAGESVLMVVGGDNLADNQESSLEIYNRSGSIVGVEVEN